MSIASYKHIMLADDDRDDIELFQSAVKECSLNIKVSIANHGQMLLELLEKEAVPDFIVLDLNMPGISGYDCLKAIRKNQKYNNVVVMILSTSSLEKDINYCLANGANYYVVKPESLNALSKLVDDLCNGAISLKGYIF
ncbi:MAG: response regulator [Segetibacter sp.]